MRKILHRMILKQPFNVVSFHTDDAHYTQHAERLKKSAEEHGVQVDIETIPTGQPWELNCAYKAKFIRDKWAASKLPIVWVDADATFEAKPELLAKQDCDFAIHRWRGWEFASGTVYFGKTAKAGRLLDAWVHRCEADPTLWDQIHLASAWADVTSVETLKTVWLPHEYCFIFDGPTTANQPVVKHWQASRITKKNGNSVRRVPQFSLHGELALRAGENWRSRYEGFWILEGERHIKPVFEDEYPEGFDLKAVLQESLLGNSPVLEYGCGVGRVASLFDPDKYVGVDINPTAIASARERLPKHQLYLHDVILKLPEAATAFAYTVFLHVSDKELHMRLAEFSSGRDLVVIAELMDRKWRRDGDPPVFNRTPQEYTAAMEKHGFELVREDKHVYKRYDTPKWRAVASPDITFLTFKRVPAPKVRFKKTNAGGELTIKDKKFDVSDLACWKLMADDESLETARFVERNLVAGTDFLDIGGKDGQTALMATALGARMIKLIEPNPINFRNLLDVQTGNDELLAKWMLINASVGKSRGSTRIGPIGEIKSEPSAKNTRIEHSKGVEVFVLRLEDLLLEDENYSLIKIDTAWAEAFIVDDLVTVIETGAAIWLSIHPPMISDLKQFLSSLTALAAHSYFVDSLNKEIPIQQLEHWIMADEEYPIWGTSFGNFFKIGILPKSSFGSDGVRKAAKDS